MKVKVIGQKVKVIMEKIVIFMDLQCIWHGTSRSKVTMVKVNGHRVEVKGHKAQGQMRVPNKGRWAHINVKLLHLCLFTEPYMT